MISARATVANLAWLASSVPAHLRFMNALRNPAAAQANWLQAHLRRNGETAYGNAHGCRAMSNYKEFARRVPIVGYDELEPWIRRIMLGESGVLTRNPVTRLLPTSGSTAARKLIPFTARLQREFNAAIGPWLVDLSVTQPKVAFGSAYWSVTPLSALDSAEESQVPIGFEDDSQYLGGLRAHLVEAAMAVPSSTRHIRELADFRRTVLLHLLRRADLRLISVWHPSFLTLLLDTLERDWDSLLGELEHDRDPRRARALRTADRLRPETIWPALAIVSCWADGQAQGAAAVLQKRLPTVTVQPKGLLATEAFVTVPFGGHFPVAVRSHFFEFIDNDGAIHPIEDLHTGQSYEVVVTTGGGLWRYRLGDRVEVTGFLGDTPTLRFLGRVGNVSDLCGEKLSETFVGQVLRALCPSAAFAMLAPETKDGDAVRRYTLYLSEEYQPHFNEFDLDRALSANPHYELCRRLQQLEHARIVRVEGNAYERFTAAETARGMRLGDIKPIALSQRKDWSPHLEKEYGRADRRG
jgi:hypothetical protein